MTIALGFYDTCIPINACFSSYFEATIDKLVSMVHGYKNHSCHALRVNLLEDDKYLG